MPKQVFCGADGHFCSVGCQVQGKHRDWALGSPWVSVTTDKEVWATPDDPTGAFGRPGMMGD